MKAPAKKEYRKPKLVSYGQVKAVTAGFSGDTADGASGNFRVGMSMGGMNPGMGM